MGRATPHTPPPARKLTLEAPTRLALGDELGRGSMATVYRAVQTGAFGVARSVAVKVFDVLASDEHDATLDTLARAIRDAACVQHPNVARTLDLGFVTPLQPFVVSELVEGRSLAALLATYERTGRRMPLDLALFIGVEAAEALDGARCACSTDGVRLGLTHGELSANDVLLSWSGEVKVTDFGVAAASRVASGIRSAAKVARRARALAPEVARGAPGDARSDVFSLGVVLREMLLGPRFPGSISDADALELARDGAVVEGVFEPKLPNELALVVHRALALDPRRRYPHAGVLAWDLRRVAFAMGVGDGRAFLRRALPRVHGATTDDETTREVTARPPKTPDPADRFARLNGVRPSGTVRVTGGVVLDDEDGIDDADEA